jgi:UDP-N-acetylglucosamine 2-epimerase (hydrolysing)
MRFNYFSELMKNAAVMVGNSSAGVREAPFLGLPSLDVGSRQNNRAQAASIVGCSALNRELIQQFLTNQWHVRYDSDATFGDGMASDQFIQALMQSEFWKIGIQK